MSKITNENKVRLTGFIVSEFAFNHAIKGDRYFKIMVEVPRNSGASDILPVIVSDKLLNEKHIDMFADHAGRMVTVNGEFRSVNKRMDNGRHRTELYVMALQFDDESGYPGVNEIDLDGYICKKPTSRKTPLGREITDVCVAVNRQAGGCDYISCIAWNKGAANMAPLPVGTHICLTGRVQSREYSKRLPDNVTEKRTAYEVSIHRFYVMEG